MNVRKQAVVNVCVSLVCICILSIKCVPASCSGRVREQIVRMCIHIHKHSKLEPVKHKDKINFLKKTLLMY